MKARGGWRGSARGRKDGGTGGREEALVKREEGSCEVEAG